MGLALPNSGCVGGLNCGSFLPFCGVLWGELEAIPALILASGCLWDDEAAPVEVSAGLRSETMAAVVSVNWVSRTKVRVTRNRLARALNKQSKSRCWRNTKHPRVVAQSVHSAPIPSPKVHTSLDHCVTPRHAWRPELQGPVFHVTVTTVNFQLQVSWRCRDPGTTSQSRLGLFPR
jgi:hypothetical protein